MTKEQDQELPGMEHRAIRALETLAAQFVALKQRRKALKDDEDALTTKIIATMRKHNKDHYKRDGIEIYIELAAEKVKVKMRQADDENHDEGDETVQ